MTKDTKDNAVDDILEAIIARIEAEKVTSSYRPSEPEYYAYNKALDKAISIIREFQNNQTKGKQNEY